MLVLQGQRKHGTHLDAEEPALECTQVHCQLLNLPFELLRAPTCTHRA